MSDNDFTTKIDVLDFIINILKEHEKSLSALVDRLEEQVQDIKEAETRRHGRQRP
jgi:hypothetical protein